ncbi:MAG: hypothetical protein VKO26_06000 [Cyanobacteriota bacterium]|nr:hypothetical protein [Cyanobacteriota bacterium]
MPFWTPALDPANPLVGSHPERYALRRLEKAGETLETEIFLGLDATDQSVQEVTMVSEAHQFLTHEAALRAAAELNRLGRGPLDVVKVGEP